MTDTQPKPTVWLPSGAICTGRGEKTCGCSHEGFLGWVISSHYLVTDIVLSQYIVSVYGFF